MGDVSKAPKRNVTKSVAAATSLTPEDAGTIFVTTTSAVTITLPPASGSEGIEYTVVKASNSANAVTVDGFGSETINGSASFASIDAWYDSATFASNGSAWFVVSKNIA